MRRRVVSFTGVALALPLWLVTLPVWVPVTVAADGISRLRRLPTLRLGLFTGVYLAHNWAGLAAACWLWLAGGFGRRMNLDAHRRVQGWWANSLLGWAGRLLGVRLHLDDTARLPRQTFIMLSRHASMVDAIIPAGLVAGTLDRFAHYVLKRELRWDPSIDLFASRLGNHFVARGADTESESDAIHRLATMARDDSVLVIFPEGTYATPDARDRVIRSLHRQGETEAATRAEQLETLLPPKPTGALALLQGRPEADVVVVGHVGLEGVAQLRGLRRRLPLNEPVRIRWWTHRRHELPDDHHGLTAWLAHRWEELDRWVTSTHSRSRPASPAGDD